MRDLFKLLKIVIKCLPLFRDVTKVYEEEIGKKKPAFLSQRVWGAAATLIGTLITVTGITVDSSTAQGLIAKVQILADSVWQIYYIFADGIQQGDFTAVGSIIDVNYGSYVALFIGIPLFIKGAKNAIQRGRMQDANA